MRLVSVNVSLGRTVRWKGRDVETGIFKEPVEGPVRVGRMNLEGDRQSDLRVHGGEYKAVYAYSADDYGRWRRELGRALPFGAFGENLTIEGLLEEEVCVGDRFRIGTAVLEAVQPRFPCFKLGLKFEDDSIVERFLDGGRWGVYFRVVDEGVLRAGDEVAPVRRDPARFPVPEMLRLASSKTPSAEALERALAAESLPPSWREKFAGRRRR
ncbi:MAG: MOSC domain-containing protein, partial [Elusimicrobia bacterium]|nr:MOSC domain-containing protein [Elusimicrobiota bacterium]